MGLVHWCYWVQRAAQSFFLLQRDLGTELRGVDPGVKCGELEGSLTSFPGTIGELESAEQPSSTVT